jgi:hypothetical protein
MSRILPSMSKIPPQRIAASCNVFYLVVIYHGVFVCGKDSKAWGIVQVDELSEVIPRSGTARRHGMLTIRRMAER